MSGCLTHQYRTPSGWTQRAAKTLLPRISLSLESLRAKAVAAQNFNRAHSFESQARMIANLRHHPYRSKREGVHRSYRPDDRNYDNGLSARCHLHSCIHRKCNIVSGYFLASVPPRISVSPSHVEGTGLVGGCVMCAVKKVSSDFKLQNFLPQTIGGDFTVAFFDFYTDGFST
jgi:hypothetical protein